MRTASALRRQIEADLANRIPAALSPAPRAVRPVAAVGIAAVDELLRGGLPVGAVTEVVGPECSGRTGLALSFVARMTAAGKVCAWVDAKDSLHPESAAANGVDLRRLLWVRCGVAAKDAESAGTESFSLPERYLEAAPIKRGLHGGGGGPHPRSEVKGRAAGVGGFLRPELLVPRCVEPQKKLRVERLDVEPAMKSQLARVVSRPAHSAAARVDQALRVTDLLLQAGGFGAIVLDFGSIEPEVATRVPLATWFRYRAAAEKSQSSILLLTRHACARSSAGLVLEMQPGSPLTEERTVFSGMSYRVHAARERFLPTNVVPMRKPPQRETGAVWQSRAVRR